MTRAKHRKRKAVRQTMKAKPHPIRKQTYPLIKILRTPQMIPISLRTMQMTKWKQIPIRMMQPMTPTRAARMMTRIPAKMSTARIRQMTVRQKKQQALA